MRVGSLFSGIGGLDLGLERAGMKIIWQVEINSFCQNVLRKHWPNVKLYGDINEVEDFGQLPQVDLICGGFPCQPVSYAGKKKGEKDERWLWPEFARAIRQARPRWVLAENVPGLLSIESGRLFGGILGDLAKLGYDAEWGLLSACAFGAPHTRERLFIIAYPSGNRFKGELFETSEERFKLSSKALCAWNDIGNPLSNISKLLDKPSSVRMADGISSTMDIRPQISAYGNAVVPQVAEYLGRRIMEVAS